MRCHTAVVTLLRDTEPQFAGIMDACNELGLEWFHLPLSGKKALSTVPAERHDADKASLARISHVGEMLVRGESVIVHCAAGMHRTGVVCYLAQRHAGVDPATALAGLHMTRPVTHEEVITFISSLNRDALVPPLSSGCQFSQLFLADV